MTGSLLSSGITATMLNPAEGWYRALRLAQERVYRLHDLRPVPRVLHHRLAFQTNEARVREVRGDCLAELKAEQVVVNSLAQLGHVTSACSGVPHSPQKFTP